MLFGNTLFCGATIVSLHNILKFFNNEKSQPHLELKMKVFFHISNIREPENQSCQPNNPLEFSSTQQCKHNVDILHLFLIFFNYICCNSITETASNIKNYAHVTWNVLILHCTVLYCIVHTSQWIFIKVKLWIIPFHLLYQLQINM